MNPLNTTQNPIPRGRIPRTERDWPIGEAETRHLIYQLWQQWHLTDKVDREGYAEKLAERYGMSKETVLGLDPGENRALRKRIFAN